MTLSLEYMIYFSPALIDRKLIPIQFAESFQSLVNSSLESEERNAQLMYTCTLDTGKRRGAPRVRRKCFHFLDQIQRGIRFSLCVSATSKC